MPSIPERLRAAAESSDFGLRELMAVREIVHAFHTVDRPEEVYQLALDRVSPLVGATFACVYLIDDGTDLMRLAAVHNWPARYSRFLGQMRVRLGQGPSGEAASSRRTIEVLDVFADPALEDWREVATELGFRALVAVPLQAGNQVVGTITFYFAAARTVGAETRHLMRVVADQLAATSERAKLITDLRAANTALIASNAQLEQQYADVLEARRIKDEFLANISHELRTPLTAVIGYISLMEEGAAGPINDEQRETLDQVKDSSEQLLDLIGDLLELTALKSGTADATLGSIDPRDPMRDAVAAAKGRKENVSIEVDEPDIVPMIRSDRRTIAKALKALVENAFKFTKEGKVSVSMLLTDDHVTYTVADTGIGIPESARSLVFEEFRQVDGTMTRPYGGSGLGLALARRLAQLLHGDIRLVSSDAGSTFTLELPRT